MFKKFPSQRSIIASAVCILVSPITLAEESDNMLEEVLVSQQRQPYRGDVPLESLPQAVQVMSGEMLANLGIGELQNALDLSASVARQNNFGGLWDAFAVRGFAGDENVPSGYLVNGFAAGRGYSGIRDSSNIERIEVLKGPGSALYGRSEPGGTINLVTKKPQFETEGYFKVAAGRWSTKRLEGDYTTKLTDSAAVRINGSYEDSDNYRGNEPESYAITPSILFLPSDRTSLSYELELVHQEAFFDRGVPSLDGNVPDNISPTTFLGDPQIGPIEVDATGHQLVLQHDLSDDWSILVGLGYRDSTFEGPAAEISLGAQPFLVDGDTVQRQLRVRDYQAEDVSGRFELNGSFNTGSIKHHLLIGVDAYEFELDTTQARWRPDATDLSYAISLRNPAYNQPVPTVGASSNVLEEQSNKAIYLQDQIDLTEKWSMLVGVRYDDYEQDISFNGSPPSTVTETSTSPRAGLVYEATQNLSVYASYSEGFRPNTGADFLGTAFEPEESKSYEVGIKTSSNDGSLSGSIALFKAEKSNILTSDPVNAGFSAALGEAESQGVELDLTGNITESLAFWFSYAYIDAETTNDVINRDWGVNVPAGSDLINIPEHSGSVSLAQNFQVGGADSSVGIVLRYVGERLGETIDPSYVLPDYTLVNVYGKYAPTDNLELSLHVDNLLDEEYFPSSYHKYWTMPGEPINYRISVTYSF